MECVKPCMDNSIGQYYEAGRVLSLENDADKIESLVKTGLIRYFAGSDVAVAVAAAAKTAPDSEEPARKLGRPKKNEAE